MFMESAAPNAPLFIEAFFDAGEILRRRGLAVPDVARTNQVLERHDVRYRVQPPDLVVAGDQPHPEAAIAVVERPPSLAEQAIPIYQRSLERSEELWRGGRDREAVQEILWLLESVTTAFRGVQTDAGVVAGAYFKDIVRDLRTQREQRPALDQILAWMTTLHGYLSAPAGGGVRHGLDLNRGLEVSHSEARLYCNLVRSYLNFLLAEHERLVAGRA